MKTNGQVSGQRLSSLADTGSGRGFIRVCGRPSAWYGHYKYYPVLWGIRGLFVRNELFFFSFHQFKKPSSRFASCPIRFPHRRTQRSLATLQKGPLGSLETTSPSPRILSSRPHRVSAAHCTSKLLPSIPTGPPPTSPPRPLYFLFFFIFFSRARSGKPPRWGRARACTTGLSCR